MKKYLPVLMLVLLPIGMIDCSSDNVETINPDNILNDSVSIGMLSGDSSVEYVSLESLPEWLRSWISSVEEKAAIPGYVFRELPNKNMETVKLYRGEWEGITYYTIINDANSCIYCDSFYEDGTRLDFENKQVLQAFQNALKYMKRIYIK
jgi:hypothetical protein